MLAARAHLPDVVNASVVVCAQINSAAIVTSDPQDVGRLVEASGAPISVPAI